MKRYDMKQGSEEWQRTRIGIPTASQFHRIITPKTGRPSEQAEAYRFELLAELMLGRPLDSVTYPMMHRGRSLEEEAANLYELQRDVTTEVVGFCTLDDGSVGASPDRLVGEDGGLELKCPSVSVHTKYLLFPNHGVDAAYKCQVLGNLYVTGRKWWDVVSYYPDLPSVIVHVDRDENNEKYIALMAEALAEFNIKLAEGKAELERRGLLNLAPSEPQESHGAMRHLQDVLGIRTPPD